jgi:4'-phosphopantetheinyl transferase
MHQTVNVLSTDFTTSLTTIESRRIVPFPASIVSKLRSMLFFLKKKCHIRASGFFCKNRMPLFKSETINEECLWGIWQTTESVEDLYQLWTPNEYDNAYFLSISHEGRRKQTLASRVLVQELLKQWGKYYLGISKTRQGKPLLLQHEYYVSVSHTEGFAAAILHQLYPVGIDIEPIKEKMGRIIPRVLSVSEYEHANQNLEMYWCAKEAIYKLHSRKELSFREQIRIKNFDMTENGTLFGTVDADPECSTCTIFYQKIHNFIVAYTFDSETSP